MRSSDEPIAALLGGLVSDARDLASAHADQIKLEVRGELRSLEETIKLTGIAIAVVVLAGLLLGEAIALGLSEASGLASWASHAIVGAAVATGGYGVLRRRPGSVDLVPSVAIAAAKRDVERIAETVS